MNNCYCYRHIEEVRAEMIRVFEACNNFTDGAVVKISQQLDALLIEHAYCTASSANRRIDL
ncbi:hypothetical protein FHS15_000893 [Paenibacillus castaneae]|uniref:aspartyl-phosphate phosphatase Spo0E family protein n=1 Tax=Paenibacillus castaneae TaxID=474957 RepID=UPI000C9CD362|nr:aspartyl-phosphate phosphatase Spo0E family protein [Paenibacillus castaneae]NIK75793.1 hypothetical protein [Paenibacillus castaneae]